MNFLDKSLRTYELHESSIKSVECEPAYITFCFDSGFRNSKHEQLADCKIIVTVDHRESDSAISYLHISKGVQKKRRLVLDDISLDDLKKLMRRKHIVIDTEYYSNHERSLVILGTVAKYKIVIRITDIKDISFLKSK